MCKYYKVNNNYFIRKGNLFVKVKKCIPLRIGSLDLFLHKYKNKFFAISESKSGLRISKYHPTSQSALDFVNKKVFELGEKRIQKLVDKKIKRDFLSPRYRFIINPTRHVETS